MALRSNAYTQRPDIVFIHKKLAFEISFDAVCAEMKRLSPHLVVFIFQDDLRSLV